MKNKCPCKECKHKSQRCSIDCEDEKYIAWKEEMNLIRQNRAKEKQLDDAIFCVKRNNLDRYYRER